MERTVSKALKAKAGIAPVLIGVWAASIALAPTLLAKGCLAGIPLFAGMLWWIINRPSRWVVCFLISSILLPPLPVSGLGNAGPHISLLFPLIGGFVGLMAARQWGKFPQPAIALLLFTVVLFASTASAAYYSGAAIAWATVARVGLFATSTYVFAFTASWASNAEWTARFVPWLFRAAIAAAAFACLDFYYQFPAPGGYGEQFVWLDNGDIVRRAQGLFYESSTLGNFCVFFLVMILAMLATEKDRRSLSRLELIVGGIILALATALCYSRGSLVSLAVAILAFMWLRGFRARLLLPALFTLPVVLVLLYLFVPSFGQNYWMRIERSFLYLNSSPDKVLSGRVSSWEVIAQFLTQHPWQNILGVGYKTLPYTTHLGEPVIADNTYLELLVEIGVVGLCVFLWMNFTLLRAGLRAARSVDSRARFFGTWFFCFWLGELVQMFSGDLITYWRVLPVYLWVLAAAMLHDRRRSLEAPG
jgi:O-antigen ligase